MRPWQNPTFGFFFFLIVVWIFLPDGESQRQSLALSDLAAERLSRYRDALGVLNTTSWGDFDPARRHGQGGQSPKFVNLTGFREDDGFAWDDFDKFHQKSLKLSRHAVPPVHGQQLWDIAEGPAVWANASGTLHGSWVRRAGSVARGYESYNLSRIVPSMDWIGDDAEWARNITGDSGKMLLRLDANKTITEYEHLGQDRPPLSGSSIRNIKGVVTIEDSDGSGFSWDMRLWGVHWPQQGVIVMTTTSEKFEGIFGLPHFTPGEDYFRSSRMLLNQTVASVIDRKEKNTYFDQNVPWSSDIENTMYTGNPSPHCELIMYAQVHPPTFRSSDKPSQDGSNGADDMIHAIEAELEDPVGAPIPSVPKLKMSAVMYSPDCAFFLETKGSPEFPPSDSEHLVGMKTEVQIHQIKTWILAYAVIVLAQVHLLKNQMKEASTPSTMGRVSFGTIGAMVIVDGLTFTAAATWVSSAAATFLPTLALMFASFLSMTIGGSFLAKIHEIQIPESRNRRDRDQGASTASSNAGASTPTAPETPAEPATGPLLPAPVTARRPGPTPPLPVIVPSDGDVDAEIEESAASSVPGLASQANGAASPSQPVQSFQSIVGRFVLLSLCISFLALASTTWYPSVRSLFLNACAFSYLSLWVPQIYRNTTRNCRRALTWPFVVGQSVLRLLPVAYFWVKPDNFLYAQPERGAFLVLCAWVWLQLVLLATQDIVGPRVGVPASWTPDAWDYHPVLREDNLESGGLPIGLVAEDNPGLETPRASQDSSTAADVKRLRGLRTIDCTICREVLDVPVVKAGDEDMSVTGVFARRMYMVTPCRHIFHTACLEGWMRFRLQCPICREELPPL